MSQEELSYSKYPFLKELGIEAENFGAYFNGKWQGNGEVLKSVNPSTEEVIATTRGASVEEYEEAIKSMVSARAEWAAVPMPVRGEIVRQIGDAFRAKK